ncbi:MAG: acyl-CoA synthetase FdrA [Candidatus Bipolaricaulota bacterium]
MSKSRQTAIRVNRYFDSVFLMAVARRLSEQPGVSAAVAVMGTPANKRTLAEMGFSERELARASSSDLIVALDGDEEAVRALLESLESWLVRPKMNLSGGTAISVDDALSRQPESNLAVVSVPGEYAAAETSHALDRGLSVFLFSDHVSIDDEIALKEKARSAGLIVMGPDCGTALIAGIGVGFANVVRRGPIGVVASSGTGLQEFACLVDRLGSGVSHGLGTGSRDLSDEVGGIATLTAIDALEADPGTEAIVVISKPPGAATLKRVAKRLQTCSKPAAACFLGLKPQSPSQDWRFKVCASLDDLALAALSLVGVGPAIDPAGLTVVDLVGDEVRRMAATQRYLRGLFAGGTFCYQSQQIFKNAGVVVGSNAPLAGMQRIVDVRKSTGHSLIDMGADEFTVGTPHPMIDATQRVRRIEAEAQDPTVAVLLLDVILGYNASSDPAGDLAEAISTAKGNALKSGRYLAVVASICGTAGDPQDLEAQERILRDVGVAVFPSNVQATRLALDLVLRRQEEGR